MGLYGPLAATSASAIWVGHAAQPQTPDCWPLIGSLRPLVRPVLARPGPRVPVLVKSIALVVESGEIRRHPDSRATLNRGCYGSGPAEA
jgi:hypothetical protein